MQYVVWGLGGVGIASAVGGLVTVCYAWVLFDIDRALTGLRV